MLKRLTDDRKRGSSDGEDGHEDERGRSAARTARQSRRHRSRLARRVALCRVGQFVPSSCRQAARSIGAVIMAISLSWSASSRRISPVTRPSRIVTMRSETARISGSSDEMAITAMPRIRHLQKQVVHLDLGADVDAARRLVDDQDLGPERQPAGQHHLLLVAAGQIGDELVGVRHADVEALAVVLDEARLPCGGR